VSEEVKDMDTVIAKAMPTDKTFHVMEDWISASMINYDTEKVKLISTLQRLNLLPSTGHGSVELFFQDGKLCEHPKVHETRKI
jgi:hypothetical protein